VIIFLAGMSSARTGQEEITVLLKAWRGGDESALARLTTLVYRELHRMAHRYLKDERSARTLQATALVNEVYLRLVDVRNIEWQHRAQFFGLTAQLMRRILVDAARARNSAKRGGDAIRIDVDEAPVLAPEPNGFILALDSALESLAHVAPRQAKVVELRYFGGLSEEETAEVMKSSPRTVRRDWQFAKAWLMHELRSSA
jgi:RNA polymerase sigma factor (TIGR02999 family)